MASRPDDPSIASDTHRVGLLRSELLQCARRIQPLGQRYPADTMGLTDAISSLVRIVHVLDQPRQTHPPGDEPSDDDPLLRDLSSAVQRIDDRATRETLVQRLAELGYRVRAGAADEASPP
jgi:hypothetical protein